MHLRLQLRLPLIVLTIVDLCISVPNLAEHHIDQNSIDVSILSNKQNEFHSNRQRNVIDTSNDDIHDYNDVGGDNSESNTRRRKNAQSTPNESSSSLSDADDQREIDDVSNNHPLNFLITNYLSDGEIERRIHFNGITAKETLVSNSG